MSRKPHVYAMYPIPTDPSFFDLKEPFKPLTLAEKQKLIAENNDNTGVPDLSAKYEMVCKLGQGTFGTVYKAREKGANNYVALKKIPSDAEFGGFPLTSIREIRLLQMLKISIAKNNGRYTTKNRENRETRFFCWSLLEELGVELPTESLEILKHENIVRLIEIYKTNTKGGDAPYIFFLTLEYCDHNLDDLLKEKRVNMTLAMRKSVIKQILNGLYFMHFSNILHRDIKAANILITKSGVVKIADFGLARSVSKLEESLQKPKTNCVVTLWYRAPELLLGARHYSAAIDMWSVGCVMAELWTRSAILSGNSEKDQLMQIISLCGSFSKKDWPEVDQLPLYNNIELPGTSKRRIVERLGKFLNDSHAINLVEKLLALNPKKRLNANDALNHKFFWENPLPASLAPVLHSFRCLKLQPNSAPAGAENYRGYVDHVF